MAVSFVSLEQTNSYLNAVLLKGLIRQNGISLVCDPENVNIPNILFQDQTNIHTKKSRKFCQTYVVNYMFKLDLQKCI